MTVSDWGSAAVPFGGPRIQQGRYGNPYAQDASPSAGGADPRYAQPAHGAAFGAAAGGVPGSDPYGAPHPYANARSPAAAQSYGAAPSQAAAGRANGRSGGRSGSLSGNAHDAGQGGSAALNIVGALLSVALVIGLGVWGYKLALRDVTGVPVVKALEGPMRIQPEDPGGIVAPHQGLAVNDVAADGVSSGPVDQLKLAPPTAELSEEDVPAHPEVEVTRAPESPARSPLPSNGSEINADAAVAEALGLTDIPGLDAPGAGNAGLEQPASATPLDVIPESVPGVVRSPRPMPRPAGYAPLPEMTALDRIVDVVAADSSPAPARPTATAGARAVVLGQEIAPAAVDPNIRLVQLGAFPSAEEARAGWAEIAAMNPELFDNRDWTIEQRVSGGTSFYRLRAIGFDGLQDARAFCAALVAAKGTCVPVVDSGTATVAGAVTN